MEKKWSFTRQICTMRRRQYICSSTGASTARRRVNVCETFLDTCRPFAFVSGISDRTVNLSELAYASIDASTSRCEARPVDGSSTGGAKGHFWNAKFSEEIN